MSWGRLPLGSNSLHEVTGGNSHLWSDRSYGDPQTWTRERSLLQMRSDAHYTYQTPGQWGCPILDYELSKLLHQQKLSSFIMSLSSVFVMMIKKKNQLDLPRDSFWLDQSMSHTQILRTWLEEDIPWSGHGICSTQADSHSDLVDQTRKEPYMEVGWQLEGRLAPRVMERSYFRASRWSSDVMIAQQAHSLTVFLAFTLSISRRRLFCVSILHCIMEG